MTNNFETEAKELVEKLPVPRVIQLSKNHQCMVGCHIELKPTQVNLMISIIASALQETYNKGKEDGIVEEAIGCNEHCEQARNEALEEAAVIAEGSWGMKRFIDSSDQEKWGQEYTDTVDSQVYGWNKAKDAIAKAIKEHKSQ